MHDRVTDWGGGQMDERIRIAAEWAWLGGVTALLAPLITSFLLDIGADYSLTAGFFGALTGPVVGILIGHLFSQMGPRGRISILCVALPVPIGMWGALVATVAALLSAQSFIAPAFFAGSFVATTQMLWFLPIYLFSLSAKHETTRIVSMFLVLIAAAPLGIVGTVFVMIGMGALNSTFGL